MSLTSISTQRAKNRFQARSRKFLRGLAMLAIFLLLSVMATNFILKFFSIKYVSCTTPFGECPQDIKEKLTSLIGKQIYSIDQVNIKSHIPKTEIIEVKTQLPNKLIVQVNIPKPEAIITNVNYPDSKFLITEFGEITAVADKQELPLIKSDSTFPLSVGQQISDFTVFSSIKLAKILKNSGFDKFSVKIEDKDIIIENISSAKVIVSPYADPAQVATTLQQVLSKATMSKSLPTRIDLRFKQPILTYQ